MKKTKIVCSIGPSSNKVEVMERMILAGMNVARINFSHATIEERIKATETVRECRKKTGKSIAILWDTKGPELRNGVLENDKVELIPGHTIKIVKEQVIGNEDRFCLNHPNTIDCLNVGNTILLENAKMRIDVISKNKDSVTCKIINGGILGSRKSISIPGIKLNIPYISDLDRKDIQYACENGGEFLAISFVSCKEDVLEVKKIIKQYNREDLKIICKIESQIGIDNIREILKVSDGIMIGRGDLGTEIPSEEVPHVQKRLIKICREMGKIVITATEMLENMMENRRPKRAETSDIANAVLDGTDAVMLSGETTVGKYPVETVQAMADICEVAEKYVDFKYILSLNKVNTVADAIAETVVDSSNRLNSKLICAATISGSTAEIISNLKPNAPILALCPDEKVGRSLALNWGVYPIKLEVCHSTDEILKSSVEKAKEFINLNKGDKILLTGSFPNTGESKSTNLMKIEEID